MGRCWKILWLGIVTFAFASNLGCTRNAGTTVTTVHLDLSSFAPPPSHTNHMAVQVGLNASPTPSPSASPSAASTAPIISHLIINIDGVQVKIWDIHNSAKDPYKADLPFTVMSGTHTYSVLLVASDAAGLMYFETGSSTTSDTDITPTLVSVGAPSGQGHISGRYLSTGGVGPTGKMPLYFISGSTTILIETVEMFGGYFSTFGLQNVPLQYQMPDGTLNFGVSSSGGIKVGVGSPLLNAGKSGSQALIYVPATWRPCTGGGCSGPIEQDSSNINIFGYFGPGAVATDRMCYESDPTPIPIQNGSAFTDAAMVTQLKYTSAPLASPQGPIAGILYGGNAASSITDCGGTPFTTSFYLPANNMMNGDGALGFTGPFAGTVSQYGGTNYLTFTSPGNGLGVSWNFLPGATSGFDGVEVFYQTVDADFSGSYGQVYRNNDSNGFYCDQLLADGFTSAGTVPVAQNSITIPSLTTSSSAEIIVCPYKAGSGNSVPATYFQSGVDGDPAMSSMMNGGTQYGLKWAAAGSGTGNESITVEATANYTQAAGTSNPSSTCKAYKISLADPMSGAAQTASSDITLNFSDNGINNMYHLSFWDTQGCQGNPGTATIAAGTGSTLVWVNSQGINNGGFDSISVNGSTSNGMVNFLTVPMGLATSFTGTPYMANVNWINTPVQNNGTVANLTLGACYPFALELTFSGQAGVLGAAANWSVTGAPGTFYKDPQCTQLASPMTIPANESLGIFYFKPSTQVMGASLSFTGSPSGSTTVNVGTANLTQVNVRPMNGMFMEGNCTQLAFDFQDEIGSPVNAPMAGVTGSLAVVTNPVSAYGQFFSDAGCSQVVQTNPITFSFNTVLYYQVPTLPGEFDFMTQIPSQSQVTIAYTNILNPGMGYMPATMTANIGNLYFTPTFTSALSIPALALANQCYPYYLYLTANGSQPASFNQAVSVTVNLSDTGQTGGGLFTDPNCVLPIATGQSTQTVMILPGQAMQIIYVKAGTSDQSSWCNVNQPNPLISIPTISPNIFNPNGAQTVCPN